MEQPSLPAVQRRTDPLPGHKAFGPSRYRVGQGPLTCSVCGRPIQLVAKPRPDASQAEQKVFLADPANWYWKHRDSRSRM